jgi:hypothetical protein
MKRKLKTEVAPAPRPLMPAVGEENALIAIALRSGTLTRTAFEAWYEKRRAEGAGFIVTLRARAEETVAPIEAGAVRQDPLPDAHARARKPRRKSQIKP